MSRRRQPQDSADELALRQFDLVMELVEAINDGGFGHREWFEYIARLIRGHRGFLSPRTILILEAMTKYGLYSPELNGAYHLSALLTHHLMRDFYTVERLYTNKGYLTLMVEESPTTLQEALDLEEKLAGDRRRGSPRRPPGLGEVKRGG